MAKTNVTPAAKWTVLPKAPDSYFAQFQEFSRPIAQLLYNRGLSTNAEIAKFLRPAYTSDLHNPRLLGGMDQAVGVIMKSIRNGEPMVIHGDYDADGITSAALLLEVLELLGAKVTAFIPDRYKDGYGVSGATLRRLHQEGAKLVITVDCGISNAAAFSEARSAGLKVVVTDHHQPPARTPEAEAVLNPHLPGDPYPNKGLTGVGVAFKLAQGLLRESTLSPLQREAAEKWLLDLVAIGTVADITPLEGENRTLVKYGLLVLRKTRRVGLQSLMRAAGIPADNADSSRIGYALAPRLNAAGRLTHAKHALELLTTTDRQRSEQLARELNQTNLERQAMTAEAVSQARQGLPELTDDLRVIVTSGSWPSGIVGLVAGRLAGEYSRPALVIEEGKTVSRGSARSIPSLNIIKALEATKQHLSTYGGHAGAAGFSLPTSKIPEFREALEAYALAHVDADDLRPEIVVEAEIGSDDLSFETLDALGEFEPCGAGNRTPEFMLKDVKITGHSLVGKQSDHLKLSLDVAGKPLTALAFGMADRAEALLKSSLIDVVGHPVANTFNNTKTLEWHVADCRAAGVS